MRFPNLNLNYFKTNVVKFVAIKTLANFLILAGAVWLGLAVFPVARAELLYVLSSMRNDQNQVLSYRNEVDSFGEMLDIAPPAPDLPFEPINTNASLLIPKINVNVPIVWNVPVASESEYSAALKTGVAHAQGTQLPANDPGNTYLFAHSTMNPLEIQKYAAVFTLLNKLRENDRITIFYEESRFEYVVENTQVVESFNTEPLKRQPEYAMLTLQTCDPPGLPLNRLIVTAKLVGEY